MSPRQFYNILQGYRRKENEAFKNSWEQARNIMYASIGPHVKKLPTIKFPWDNEQKNKTPITKKQSVAFWEKVDQKTDN